MIESASGGIIQDHELVWFDRSGQRVGKVEAPAAYRLPILSPDGRRITVTAPGPGSRTEDVWMIDTTRGTTARLTFDDAAPALAAFIKGGRVVPAARPTNLAPLADSKARQLREGYNALAEALNATRRAIAEHNARGGCRLPLPPAPVAELRALRDLIKELGEPRRASPGEAP